MEPAKSLKEKVYSRLCSLADQKIEEISNALESAKASRDTESKSTAGDKHETGRAMMQIEMENLQVQLNHACNSQKALSRINIHKKSDKAEFGSLVVTNLGSYFISVGLGKVKLENQTAFAVSAASPIGQVLTGKTEGDKFTFRGRQFEVREVV